MNSPNETDGAPKRASPRPEVLPNKGGEEQKSEARPESRRVRHRLLGAAACFAVAALLWQFGESVPPPTIKVDAPPARTQSSLADKISEVAAMQNKDSETSDDDLSVADQAGGNADNSPIAGKFAVQVGAFKKRQRAVRLMTALSEKKYRVHISETRRQGVSLYRVRVLGFQDRIAAEQERRRLISLPSVREADIIELK